VRRVTTTPTRQTPTSFASVRGWFYQADQALITWFLDRQERLEPPGDLVELGSYLGKSAILIGGHLREGETFTVCDLFDSTPADAANQRENNFSYSTLTRQGFEANYLAFHEQLPVVIQDTTDQITKHVEPQSCRFVHVDASHLWEHVHGDIEAARVLLRPNGLIVCDDYRSAHTPGVAAAVWTAVANGGLRPICVTGNKFYGTFGDPEEVQAELVEWLNGFDQRLVDLHEIMGHQLVRVCKWDKPPLPTLLPLNAEEVEEPASSSPARTVTPPVQAKPKPKPKSRWSSPRSIARELLPPVLTRAIKRAIRS
jgi:predicted O-methyltransferase YrrM